MKKTSNDKKKLNGTLILAYQNHKENNLDIAEGLYEEVLERKKIYSYRFGCIFHIPILNNNYN